MYHLSASVALRFSSLLVDGAEYRHFQFFLGVRGLWFAAGFHRISVGHLHTWTRNVPFLPILQFLVRFFCLLTFCCAILHIFLHSQSGPGSWHICFLKKVLSSCSCEGCLGAMLLFPQRFCGDTLVCFAALNTAEAALHYVAVQVWANHCFGCRRGAWLTAVFLTTCLLFFSKIYIEVWIAEQSKMALCN